MSRITYELGFKGSGEYDTDNTKDMPVNNFIKAINKLGPLEDREEKFGIDLLLLLDAMSSGIYRMFANGDIKYFHNWEFWLCDTAFGYALIHDKCFTYLNDYGKKEPGGWALTMEKLL